jgi:hypothetical protein
MRATSMVRSSTVVALVALLGGRASAQPGPIEPVDPPTPPAPTEHDADRDHDRDLDHDDAHWRDATTEPKPPSREGGDPDRPLVAPRLTRDAMRDIVVDTPGERSSTNIAVLAGMTTGALAAGVFGLYFHLQGQKAANAVASTGFTGRFWTPADQAQVDKADRDRMRTIVLYSTGGAMLVAAIVTLIATEPKSTRTVIHPHAAMIAPIPDGVVIARGWTF